MALGAALPPSLLLGQESLAAAQGADLRPSHFVARSTGPVVVDGVLDEPTWGVAASIDLPWEVAPAANGPAPVETECRFLHDDEHLYVGCTARDPDPSAIRAFVSDRDDLDGQDRIVVLLDLFDDARRGVELSISPLGVQGDATFSQAISPSGNSGAEDRDPSWDAIWGSAGRITEDGYVIEASVPFRSLRFPRTEGERRWGMQITRWWPRGQEVQLRSVPLDRGNACHLCQAGELRGLDGIAPGRNVQVTPSLTAGRSDRRVSAGDLGRGDVTGEVGVTGTWGIVQGVTLNATLNPDFSQVEADVAQLDVNSPVALFFPEKRSFFLEGADLFTTPIRAVFTRTIADPSAGAKLSGKVGGTGFGLLLARDEADGLLLPGVQTSADAELGSPPTTLVARLRQDVGASSTVGGLYVGREAAAYSNRVWGADAFLQPLAPLRIRIQYLLSHTDYPARVAALHGEPDEPFSGAALQGQVNWSAADWSVNGVFNSRSGGFRADAGFVPEVGSRGGNLSLHRQFWGSRDSWFSRVAMQVGTWRTETQDGQLLDGDGMWMGLEYDGPGQTSLSFFPNAFFRTHFGGRTYAMSSYYGSAGAQPWAGVAVRLNGVWGDAIDFVNARKADNLVLTPELDLRLGRRTELRLSHSLQRLSTDGSRIVTANLFQTRAVYNFSARSFVRAIVQYRDVERNPSRHVEPVDERSRRVFGQLLYSYKLNPESVLFLGYTDDLRGTAVGRPDDLSFERQGRSFFLKLSYAWRP